MSFEAQSFPSDPTELHALCSRQAAEIERLSSANQRQEIHLKLLQEQITLLTAKRFGPSSEKCHPDQLRIFNEVEALTSIEAASSATVIEVPAHQRRRGGRKPLPTQLPRIEVIHDLDAQEKFCAHDGEALVEIGEECSEQLDIIPAQVRVIRRVRKKYACPQCSQGVKTASLPTHSQELGFSRIGGTHYAEQISGCATASHGRRKSLSASALRSRVRHWPCG